MRLLLALDQRCRGVDPRHGAMQQKIPHGEVGHLPEMTEQSLFTGERAGVTRETPQAGVLMPLPLFSLRSAR